MNANQRKHKSQTNAKVKATVTPKTSPIRPRNQIKINFKNKPMSKTHELTHEQTCCKWHKQTHNITVALMRKEMQNWPTNRIENATKMHEQTHGQRHTNTRTKLLTNPTLGPGSPCTLNRELGVSQNRWTEHRWLGCTRGCTNQNVHTCSCARMRFVQKLWVRF